MEKYEGINPEDIAMEIYAFCNRSDFLNPNQMFAPSFIDAGNHIEFASVSNYKVDLDADRIMKGLNYKPIDIKDLPKELIEEIKLRPSWPGSPFLNNGRGLDPNVKLYKSSNGKKVYSIREEAPFFSWSSIERRGNKAIIKLYGKDENISSLIHFLGHMEIGNKKAPEYFTYLIPQKTLRMNAGFEVDEGELIQRDVRGRIKGLKKSI